MLLFIEGYPYSLNDVVKDGLTVRDVLNDVVSVPVKEDKLFILGMSGIAIARRQKMLYSSCPK